MLINLYGNIVNPKLIMHVTINTSGDGYWIFFVAAIDIRTTENNVLEIPATKVQAVDETGFHIPTVLYMQKSINDLERLADASAEIGGTHHGDEKETDQKRSG